MASAGGFLHVHQFIDKMKEEQTEQLNEYLDFSQVKSTNVENNLSMSDIPKSETQEQKFIHGNIFEYAVQQAAEHTSKKNDPWTRFRELYRSMKGKKREQYKTFMDEAGQAAWDMFYTNVETVYGSEKNSIPSFEHTIQNNTLPILSSKLEADIFVSSLPNIVCEIKYSTMDKDSYEREYLVNAIVQVLIYSLALKLDPSTLHLQILVFFSKTREVVLYKSDIHKNETLVNLLVNELNGNPEKVRNKEELTDDETFRAAMEKLEVTHNKRFASSFSFFLLPYLCVHNLGLVRVVVGWVCFDVLFFILEFHFLFLLIFILFSLACLYMCCWCFPLWCLFQCFFICLFVLLFYFVFIPFLYLFIVYVM